VITDVVLQTQPSGTSQQPTVLAQMDLIGEIVNLGTPTACFQRGVMHYPLIGDRVGAVSSHELRLIFEHSGAEVVQVGHLQPYNAIPAYVKVHEMLSKHFAVLGTTGVGKSSTVTLLLRQILSVCANLRILVLDVHNEYGRCFGEQAQVLNPNNIKLPFWLFNFEEIVDVFFGGRPGLEDEIDILAEIIPLAKSSYGNQNGSGGRLIMRNDELSTVRYTVDVPVPYRIADILALLNTQMGKLENRSSRMLYHKLITRIESVCNDPHYSFMFDNANVGWDTIADVLGTLFRLPINGIPMTVMQLAGFPSEVVDAVVSVTCRMAFDVGLWSDGANPLLVICEEAHRYMAADPRIGFAPTRRSMSRIAKEGRKYGVFLGLVSQSAAEIDPTILSQCSTLFAMRMTNDRDQALLRSAVADTTANVLAFLPSLGAREAFAFGEGVAVPTRLKFNQLPQDLLPKTQAVNINGASPEASGSGISLASVIERWRGQTHKQRMTAAKSAEHSQVTAPSAAESGPVHPPPQPDPDRFKLLEGPLQY
jgi:DNA helicase HerA-like ATPase